MLDQRASDTADELDGPQVPDAANRKNMVLLIQLRWIAVIGQIVTMAVVQAGIGIPLPLRAMSAVLGLLVLLNLASILWLRRRTVVGRRDLLLGLLLDVACQTAQLWLSGGDTNPFTALYLLQVTLGAVLLDGWRIWVVVALAFAGFTGLAVSYRPLVLPRTTTGDLFSLHLLGMLVCLTLDALLLVIFVTRITRNLRERDLRLAALKQHTVEETHIVRMGLLASGAAHELGTPLASLSVILGDWRRMPAIAADPDMTQELEEMQAAVRRCKAILTGILLSAGEARGEAPLVTTVSEFLLQLVHEWRAAHAATLLIYENNFPEDQPIISDSALKQVIFNVLENAFEAAPRRITLVADRGDAPGTNRGADQPADMLMLQVRDEGPGFAPEMLAEFGKPYHSSKGRLGGGLGLFLVVNVVRKLGGSVSAHNHPLGGAVVTLNLPLTALSIQSRAPTGVTGARAHAG